MMLAPLSPLVIARSTCDEAIQTASAEAFLDCFAALAMTEQDVISVAQTHTHTN
ncbi:hypothetical protein IQ17_03585 [Bradyrhizobium daqingense]|uniref:Uncharacterized protein n=1 Tax=Bradyrhizobium daqingense TaxID=993502 RepID=A0A562L9G1_9BRAD|nr:hypothetical protein IQ17_03585 [Bradyrhizobium daqingense]